MWNQFKSGLLETIGLGDRSLHVALGAAIYIVVALITRRPWLSLGAVALIQGLNEALDLFENITRGGAAEAAMDTVLTLAIPTALAVLTARRKPYKCGSNSTAD